MAGFLPNEGEEMIANIIFKGSSVDRGTGMQLGLFTNSTGVDETITCAALTEPSGGSYARISLANASWTITPGTDTATFAQQTFTATGSDMTPAIYGYFICTTGGTTNRIVDIAINPTGPFTMLQDNTFKVTPTIKVA